MGRGEGWEENMKKERLKKGKRERLCIEMFMCLLCVCMYACACVCVCVCACVYVSKNSKKSPKGPECLSLHSFTQSQGSA